MYARELRLQKEGVRNIKHTESNVQLKLDATAGSSLTSHDAGLTSSSTGRSLSSTGRTAGLSSQSGSRIGVTAADLLRVSAKADFRSR